MKLTQKNKKKFLKNEKGQGMVEYILLLVVVIGLVIAFKPKIQKMFGDATSSAESGVSNVLSN